MNSTATGGDADPGNGVCEATAGAGDCTLVAAVQEGNALGHADIDLPSGQYGNIHLVVTGDLRVNPGQIRTVNLHLSTVTVAAGGALVLDGLQASPALNGGLAPITGVTVDGVLVMRQSWFIGSQLSDLRTAMLVHAGGVAVLENSAITGIGGDVVANQGTVVLRNSSIGAGSATAFNTTGAGATRLISSELIRFVAIRSLAPLCAGTAPISDGYNIANDESCGLSGPLDLQNNVAYQDDGNLPGGTSAPGSPAIDRVPVGVNGCGTQVTQDYFGRARPTDGDGDLVAGCDSGPGERPAPPP